MTTALARLPRPDPSAQRSSDAGNRPRRFGLLLLCLVCAALHPWSLAPLDGAVPPVAAGGMRMGELIPASVESAGRQRQLQVRTAVLPGRVSLPYPFGRARPIPR